MMAQNRRIQSLSLTEIVHEIYQNYFQNRIWSDEGKGYLFLFIFRFQAK